MALTFHAQIRDAKLAREKDHRVIEIKLRAAMDSDKLRELYDLMDGSPTAVSLKSSQGVLPWQMQQPEPETEGEG